MCTWQDVRSQEPVSCLYLSSFTLSSSSMPFLCLSFASRLVRFGRAHTRTMGHLATRAQQRRDPEVSSIPHFAFFFSNKETRSLARIYSLSLLLLVGFVFLPFFFWFSFLFLTPFVRSVSAFSAFSASSSSSAFCLVNVFMLGARCNNKYREFGFKFSELLVHFLESNWVDGVARHRHRASSPLLVFLSLLARFYLYTFLCSFFAVYFVSSNSSILVVSRSWWLGARPAVLTRCRVGEREAFGLIWYSGCR